MTSFKRQILTWSLASAVLFTAHSSQALTLGKIEDTTLTFGGYVKMDAIASDYSDGTLGAGTLGRDFYVPALTPVGGEPENTTIDIHARQTRFNIGTDTEVNGHQLQTFIELDFLATPNGDERVTNSYTPRMRHAFLAYDNWLFGQTWSTFQNVGALPETVDFIGNTDFGIFVRQGQVRYTRGNVQMALENPETTVTPYGGGPRVVTDDNELPDLVLRYNMSGDGLSLVTAVLLRQLTYNNYSDGGTIDETESAFGLSVSGKYMLAKNDIRFGVNTGQGMGRYIGLNTANGAQVLADGSLEALDSTGGYIAYRHLWNQQWRSNITISAISIDNGSMDYAGATKSTRSFRLNVMHSPVPNLTLGGEFTRATRKVESGAQGDMNRLQFSAMLSF